MSKARPEARQIGQTRTPSQGDSENKRPQMRKFPSSPRLGTQDIVTCPELEHGQLTPSQEISWTLYQGYVQ